MVFRGEEQSFGMPCGGPIESCRQSARERYDERLQRGSARVVKRRLDMKTEPSRSPRKTYDQLHSM